MPTFPFLKLPPNLQEAIARKLELLDLFLLSQCSKKSFDIVRTARLKGENKLVLRINLSRWHHVMHHVIKLTPQIIRFQQSETLTWKIYHKRDPRGVDLENPRACKVQGIERTISLGQEAQRVFECTLSSSEIFLFIVQIMKLFNAEIHNFDCSPYQMDCLKGLISIGALRECGSFFLSHGRVTHEEMSMILENAPARQFVSLASVTNGFVYDKIISFDWFRVYNSPWINIFNLDCEKIHLNSSCGVTSEILNTFIRRWLNGTDKKLEHLHYSPEKEMLLDLAEIVRGLPTVQGSPKRLDATNYHNLIRYPVSYEDGLDLRRESDGTLATVLLSRHQRIDYVLYTFGFIVWNDPNPYLIAP